MPASFTIYNFIPFALMLPGITEANVHIPAEVNEEEDENDVDDEEIEPETDMLVDDCGLLLHCISL